MVILCIDRVSEVVKWDSIIQKENFRFWNVLPLLGEDKDLHVYMRLSYTYKGGINEAKNDTNFWS